MTWAMSQLLFKAGYQRRNAVGNGGGQGGIGNGQKHQRGGKHTDDALPVLEFHKDIEGRNRPGEKHQGFVHVGKGRMAVPHLIGLDPAHENAGGIARKPGDKDPKTDPCHEFFFKCPGTDVKHR